MLRILKVKKSYDKNKSINKFELYLNDELYEGVDIYEKETKSSLELLVLEINAYETTENLKELPLHAFTAFKKIIFNNWSKSENVNLKVEIDWMKYRNDQGTLVIFSVEPDFLFLEETIDVTRYPNLFDTLLTETFSDLSSKIIDRKLDKSGKLKYLIYHDFRDRVLRIEFGKYEEVFTYIHNEIFNTLPIKLDSNREIPKKDVEAFLENELFLTSFNFPDEIKIHCNQYLLYFAQFLKDVGIKVTSNLKEEAGKVLFSVTPTDDIEALDKIREALAVYLKLPESPIVYDDSFAAMRLKSEIERLQSSQRIAEMEFRVAQKALESQDKIILQQSILLEQQAKSIEKIASKSVMIDSAENKEELEEICEGLKIGKSKFLKEQLGIDFNPATFGKGIGRKILGIQETNSIIETDEENK